MSLRSRVNAPREVATYRTYSEQVASQTTAATITRAVPAPAGAIPKLAATRQVVANPARPKPMPNMLSGIRTGLMPGCSLAVDRGNADAAHCPSGPAR